MKKIYFAAGLLAVAFNLAACKDEYTLCNLSKEVRFTGGFYKKVGSSDALSPAPKFTLLQLNTTVPLYSQQVNVETFSLPLNPVLDSAKYVLTLNTGLQADTITIIYTSQGVNLSVECGSVTYNTINKVTTTINTLDSVKIIKGLVNTEAGQNVKIYY